MKGDEEMDVILNNSVVGQVNGPLQSVIFDTKDAVHDEIRGYLVYVNSNWSFVGPTQYSIQYNNETIKKLALVLESPHKDEYDNNFVPLRPANGKTGNSINTKICSRGFISNLNN